MFKRPMQPKTMEDSGPALDGQTARIREVVRYLCFFVMGCTCLDLAGWILHIPVLTSFIPHYATMKPNTALCLGMLAAACLMSLPAAGASGKRRRVTAVCLASVALILVGGTLLEYLSTTNLGLDTLILTVPAEGLGEPIARMSVGTAICLTLIGLSVLLYGRATRFCTGSLLVVLVIALSALVGFLFSAGPLNGVPWLRSMAVHTSVCMLSVSIASLISHPEREPVASLFRQTFGGGAPQRLLIGVTVLPIVVALPAVIAMRHGVVDVGFTMALVVVLLIGLQTWILWRDSQTLHRAQQRRKQVESDLARSERFAVIGRLSASISHELADSLDTARNLVFLIDGAKSLSEAKDFASMAGTELASINQISSQTIRFHEPEPGLMKLRANQGYPAEDAAGDRGQDPVGD